ncbi:MAG: class I SAM-dependent methyltransferase [Lentisphaerae bacterium]|nr:class I SAM-dependent methyltransferase [Lentisphaerota bacterium]
MAVQADQLPVEAEQELYVFRRRLTLQIQLQETLRFLPDGTEGKACLSFGAGNSLLSHHLRRLGGEWQAALGPEQDLGAARAVLGDKVHVHDGGRFPFGDKQFDVLVVFGGLQRAADEEAFIAECHRVMKPDGRLILHVDHAKPVSLLGPLQRLLRVSPERMGMARPGYTESALFALLKHGFDVYQVRSYVRFGVGLTDAAVQAVLRHSALDATGRAERARRVYAVAGLIYKLAYQMDALALLTRGHRLVAMAKRRAWRPRKAPVLVDGRSITEAVLSRAAD